jgi:hypothetical protein
LIGVAAAVQFAIFPVWLGSAFVLGVPQGGIVGQRLGGFLINLTAISVMTVVAYAGMHMRMSGKWSAPLSGRRS